MTEYCERCAKHGIKQEMRKEKISIQEVKEKILIGNFPLSKYIVYVGYNYFECPICRWFKFVVKK